MDWILIAISSILVFVATIAAYNLGFKKGKEYEKALQMRELRLKEAKEREVKGKKDLSK